MIGLCTYYTRRAHGGGLYSYEVVLSSTACSLVVCNNTLAFLMMHLASHDHGTWSMYMYIVCMCCSGRMILRAVQSIPKNNITLPKLNIFNKVVSLVCMCE